MIVGADGNSNRYDESISFDCSNRRFDGGRGASLAMGVAFVGFTTQFGLIPLVKTGYSYIGYATLIVIVIPFIVHMIVGCVKKQPVMGSEAAEN